LLLESGGIDVWYVDESMDPRFLATAAIAIPLLRNSGPGWQFAWDNYLDAAMQFRRRLKATHGIAIRKELHAVKLASGRGRYRYGKEQFSRKAASGVYRWILSELGFLPERSIITVVGKGSPALYGHRRLEASMYALFQRMQRASHATSRNGMTFFDEGHGEYRKLYRKARIYLPTGSRYGGWTAGASKNIPMGLFFKDANFKRSVPFLPPDSERSKNPFVSIP